jgi:hypothetical protein
LKRCAIDEYWPMPQFSQFGILPADHFHPPNYYYYYFVPVYFLLTISSSNCTFAIFPLSIFCLHFCSRANPPFPFPHFPFPFFTFPKPPSISFFRPLFIVWKQIWHQERTKTLPIQCQCPNFSYKIYLM